MSLFMILRDLESNEDFHLGRILVLLNEFNKTDKGIEGLTKLAKLDFLLRYPSYLERALVAAKKNPELALVREFERQSVEAKMVRFKYGPWDFRYRKFLNVLVGKGLVYIQVSGRSINLNLTGKGAHIARLLAATSFNDVSERAIVVKRYFDFSGNYLKNFIYKTFPEIVSLKYGTEIK